MASSNPKIKVFEPESFYLDFDSLNPRNHKVTSEATPNVPDPRRPYSLYNCFAIVVGDQTKVWWPDGVAYWPKRPADDTVAEIARVLIEDYGYKECDHGEFESGKRKVAIFADDNLVPQHVAFQPQYTGSLRRRWKSKMGLNVDIEHELMAVCCKLYGKPVKYLYIDAQGKRASL